MDQEALNEIQSQLEEVEQQLLLFREGNDIDFDALDHEVLQLEEQLLEIQDTAGPTAPQVKKLLSKVKKIKKETNAYDEEAEQTMMFSDSYDDDFDDDSMSFDSIFGDD